MHVDVTPGVSSLTSDDCDALSSPLTTWQNELPVHQTLYDLKCIIHSFSLRIRVVESVQTGNKT